jgi:hypothetical protein
MYSENALKARLGLPVFCLDWKAMKTLADGILAWDRVGGEETLRVANL